MFNLMRNNLYKKKIMHYYKLFKVIYEKLAYKNTIFVSENLWNNIKFYYLFAWAIFIS
jgi:hypothetical protein